MAVATRSMALRRLSLTMEGDRLVPVLCLLRQHVLRSGLWRHVGLALSYLGGEHCDGQINLPYLWTPWIVAVPGYTRP
jgi:hypothetical protein